MTSVPTAISMDLGSHHITYHFDTASKLIWKDGGNYNFDKNITSLTLTPSDTNQTIIDYLVIVPQDMFNKEMSDVKKILAHVITINEFTPPKVNLDKKKFITTDTRIKALESTKYLSYAFSWGKHWRGNADAIKYISDGYGMTFVAKSNDLTQISYYPDTIFQVSLIISTITFILLLLSLITIIIKEKYKLLLNRR
jgi:hypothetical protein